MENNQIISKGTVACVVEIKVMDHLKNVFQSIEGSSTEDKVYSCQLLFPIVMSFIESVTSLIIGVHYSSQDKPGDATLFLKVAGGILLGLLQVLRFHIKIRKMNLLELKVS